eukprot:4398855-Alexandrium_andersonii.AAC.1
MQIETAKHSTVWKIQSARPTSRSIARRTRCAFPRAIVCLLAHMYALALLSFMALLFSQVVAERHVLA